MALSFDSFNLNNHSVELEATTLPILGSAEVDLGYWWSWLWTGWLQAFFGVAVVSFLVYEQISYHAKGGSIGGPRTVTPLVGGGLKMVASPIEYWKSQAQVAKLKGLSWNVLFGKFAVLVIDTELSHKVFTNARPGAFRTILHPYAKRLFGKYSPTLMSFEKHSEMRRRLGPHFTGKALEAYVPAQESVARKHISKWVEQSLKTNTEPMKLRLLIRSMIIESSQATFVGPYMSDETLKANSDEYALVNVGLMAIPVNLPGFVYHKAVLAGERLSKSLGDTVKPSMLRMATGAEPCCVMDFWTKDELQIRKASDEAEKAKSTKGVEELPIGDTISSEAELGGILFNFLLAGQDGTATAATWAVVMLESRPDILERVREEQRRVRPDPSSPITPQQIYEMEFTTMVAKEVIRYRPPFAFIAHEAIEDFPITSDYTIPKGSMALAHVIQPCHTGFPNGREFDPDRFSPERKEDVLYKSSMLMFGAGRHACVAQRYVINQLVIFLALFSPLVDCTRVRTPGCDESYHTPSLAPKDDALVRLVPRTTCVTTA